jgi:hypothetical protein
MKFTGIQSMLLILFCLSGPMHGMKMGQKLAPEQEQALKKVLTEMQEVWKKAKTAEQKIDALGPIGEKLGAVLDSTGEEIIIPSIDYLNKAGCPKIFADIARDQALLDAINAIKDPKKKMLAFTLLGSSVFLLPRVAAQKEYLEYMTKIFPETRWDMVLMLAVSPSNAYLAEAAHKQALDNILAFKRPGDQDPFDKMYNPEHAEEHLALEQLYDLLTMLNKTIEDPKASKIPDYAITKICTALDHYVTNRIKDLPGDAIIQKSVWSDLKEIKELAAFDSAHPAINKSIETMLKTIDALAKTDTFKGVATQEEIEAITAPWLAAKELDTKLTDLSNSLSQLAEKLKK